LGRVDVARATKVWIHQLAALEHDDYDALLGDETAANHLRIYAEYLGFDPDPVVAEFLGEIETRRPAADPTPAEPAEAEEALPVAEVSDPEPAVETALLVPDDVEIESQPSVESTLEDPVADDVVAAEPEPVADEPLVTEPVAPDPVTPEPVAPQPREEPRARWVKPGLAIAMAGLVVVLIWLGLQWAGVDSTPVEPPTPSAATPSDLGQATDATPRMASVTATPPVVQPELEAPEAGRPAPVEKTPTKTAPPPAAGVLTIPDHGVGTRIENNRLVGQSDRFREGDRIWFWNRVLGGGPGRTIRHVWTKDGVAITNATLELGGSHWRTNSRKTLYPGSAGSWTVEALDEEGNVLARREFTCTP
jgi:hypothetical protein